MLMASQVMAEGYSRMFISRSLLSYNSQMVGYTLGLAQKDLPSNKKLLRARCKRTIKP